MKHKIQKFKCPECGEPTYYAGSQECMVCAKVMTPIKIEEKEDK